MIRRLRLEIQGAVQGVGFRPFIYRLATNLALNGWIINDTHGVFIEVEGEGNILQSFLVRLPEEQPPLARIHSMTMTWLDPLGYEHFEIRQSNEQGDKSVLVLPDIALCTDCLHEVLAPTNRRYHYPFTNCTNCGPRFSIIQSLPYDRANTTMHHFTMCAECQEEYEDPRNRRFHAQPNACSVCGPALSWWQKSQPTMTWSQQAIGKHALRATANALRDGHIVAVKGLGGFHLMVDAQHTDALVRLRERKPRLDKPFALMVRDITQAKNLCCVSPLAERLLTSPESPILLLPRQKHAPLSELVAPGMRTLGIMLPYTPLHHLLLREVGFPLVATSGNLTDEPLCTDNEEAIQRLGHIADSFLLHNRPIQRHVDDSIAWVVEADARLLRRARGYAPLPLLVPGILPTILAVGGHIKNTIALSIEPQSSVNRPAWTQVLLSQHIGDLETPEAMAAFEHTIADFLRLYEAIPLVVAHDLHPDYVSTRWAYDMAQGAAERGTVDDGAMTVGKHRTPAAVIDASGKGNVVQQYPPLKREARYGKTDETAPSSLAGIRTIAVQHHHAHLAACLADNNVEGRVLGVIWDGTGYGPDGTIWGGEFLVGNAASYSRFAHLRPFRLPGGDAAVREPRRVALALLWEIYGEAAFGLDDLPAVQSCTPHERKVFAQMLQRDINTPQTTSAGRLFDGVAALIGVQQTTTFEGQAAIALEHMADERPATVAPYPLPMQAAADSPARQTTAEKHPAPLVLDWEPMITAIISDLRQVVAPSIMSQRFHYALSQAIVQVAQRASEARVALSGGCFQNRFLVEQTSQRLRDADFEVLLHRQVPPNDGGISLGQVMVAAHAASAVQTRCNET